MAPYSEAITFTVVAGTAMSLVVLAMGAATSSTQLSTVAIPAQTRTVQAVSRTSGSSFASSSSNLAAPAEVNQQFQQSLAAPSPSTFQVTGTLCALAMGASAMAALVMKVLAPQKQDVLLPYGSIAMAATTGSRPMWIPGGKAPAHLTGEFPGDRGFDPLGLSKDPKTFERMRIAEVFHGRLAMLGVVGCLVPELFFHKEAWYDFSTTSFDKFGLLSLQIVAPLEYWRGNGGFGWKNEGMDRCYPGFDPLELTSDVTKLKEIKNGRLAMLAMLGFEAQRHITGQSPVANLAAHLADPIHVGYAPFAMFGMTGEKKWGGNTRPLWFPGGYAPAHLTGEFPGDRGFDPFNLAVDPANYAKYRVAEVFHGRLAMLAVFGAIFEEAVSGNAWYDVPGVAGVDINQVGTAVLLAALPEFFRGQGGFVKGAEGRLYPGFDPLKLTSARNKEAEIKNGRLAMVAIAGFFVQHQVTGKSPVQDFLAHWYNPLGENIAGNLAMFATTGQKDGLWFPNVKAPAHLTGQMLGDRGFDPLGLAVDPAVAERMQIAEVFHGRLAMLGVAGSLLPELLGNGAWYQAGDKVDAIHLAFLFMAAAAPIEYFRGQQGLGWDKGTGNPIYPGFDPARLSSDRNKVAEIKNGRLAMAAILGFAVQYQVTGASPLANLAAHLANPVGVNITTSVGMFATSGEKAPGVWFPNYPRPAYLTGEFPGDRGFDPAGMSADPVNFERMRIAEVFHGRLAMLGVVGCIWPEVLGKAAWYDFGDLDVAKASIIALQIIAPLEYWRGNGGFGWNGEDEGRDRSYPGFDPLGITDEGTKVGEVKNGRLAMLAMAGFEAQHHVTGQSPLQNLAAHLADPVGNNIAASLMNNTIPVAMFAAAGQKDGMWFPGAKAPAHLTGEFAGDRGFDPLGLAVDPAVYARMRIAEVYHGRLAMLGVAGSILPELLGKGAWFEAGNAVDATKFSLLVLSIAAPTEYWRGQGGFGWNKGTMDPIYPGFDPAKLNSERNKVAEIKNGRLAMAAILGLEAQRALTGASPLAALASHLADPVANNIVTSHYAML